MSKIKETTIDGKSWRVSKFGGLAGLKLLTRLTILIGPSLGGSIKELKGLDINLKSILSADIPVGTLMESFGSGIEDFASRLDDETFPQLIQDLLVETKCDGKEVSKQFDILFAGEYLTLFKVVYFVLQVNYPSFLGGGKLALPSEEQED